MPQDQARLKEMEKDKLVWKNAAMQCRPLDKKVYITVKGIKISPKEDLTYNDDAAEEAGVAAILRGLRLIR